MGGFYISGLPNEFTCPLCGVRVPPLCEHRCENGESKDSKEPGDPNQTIGAALAAAMRRFM